MCRSQANYCGNFNCSLKYSVRSILDLFQGIGTMFAQSPQIAIARVVVKCRMRVPFVTQESLFVNENLIL